MRQPTCARALLAVLIAALVPAAAVQAQERAEQTTITAMPLHGGLAAARAAAGDTGQADAGQFVVDVIRRSFQTPMSLRGVRRETVIRPLLEHLDRARQATAFSDKGTLDRWPLPLTASAWTRSILTERSTDDTLLADILRSPAASLMYCALLSLDDPTRRWFDAHPALLAEIATRHAPTFLIAAPGLRISNGTLQLPGGAAATAAWEAAAGRRVSDPAEFIKGVLAREDPGLPYLLGGAAQLTPGQVRFVLGLDSADAARISALNRLVAAIGRASAGWDLTERPFWRPVLDPIMLASDLHNAGDGAVGVPGTAAFWSAAFSGGDVDRHATAQALATLVAGPPVEFAWLCEQVFTGGQTIIRGPYQLVLFASRLLPAVTAGNARAALGALRSAREFPALAGTLERAHITDLTVYVDAARAARTLAEIDDHDRAGTALAQFQGALAIVARATTRGSLSPDRAGRLVSALSAIEPDARGEYAGKIVEWVASQLLGGETLMLGRPAFEGDAAESSDIEQRLLALVSGTQGERGPAVDWEGTRYRVSFPSAEARRLHRLLGEAPRPYVAAADALVRTARAFEGGAPSRQVVTAAASAAAQATAATQCAEKNDWSAVPMGDRCRDVVTALEGTAKRGDIKAAQRLAPRLRQLSDAMLGRGLLVLAYAVGFGEPDNAAISPLDAASRHVFGFGLPGFGRAGTWRWPAAGADRVRDWHVTGSMLGIDVTLSNYSLVRLSTRPPSARPTLNDEDRIVLTESVVLMEPDLLTAENQAAIVRALKRGRERLASLSPTDAGRLADEIRMPPMRRSIFVWNASEDARRAAASLGTADLFALGLEGAPVPAGLDAWGVSAEPRLVCRCLQLPRRPFEAFAGRWFSGVLASGFADVNLRIAELLHELNMPAALLAPVLASATWDFVMNVKTNDFDDRNGWIEFARGIGIDRVEQYLALLTTDGPLVPVSDGSVQR